jgi:hypothetical protein
MATAASTQSPVLTACVLCIVIWVISWTKCHVPRKHVKFHIQCCCRADSSINTAFRCTVGVRGNRLLQRSVTDGTGLSALGPVCPRACLPPRLTHTHAHTHTHTSDRVREVRSFAHSLVRFDIPHFLSFADAGFCSGDSGYECVCAPGAAKAAAAGGFNEWYG